PRRRPRGYARRTGRYRRGRDRRGRGPPAHYRRGAPARSPRRAGRRGLPRSSDRRTAGARRTPSPPDVFQSLAGLLEHIGGRVFLRDELSVDDLGRVVLLERGEAGAGAEQPVASGRRVGRDVRRGHEVLGGRELVTLALVRLGDRAGRRRDDALVVGSHEAIEDLSRVVPALVLREQARVAERHLGPEVGAGWIL